MSVSQHSHALVAEVPVVKAPTPDDPAIIADLAKLGGRFFQDYSGRVTKVILHRCQVTDVDLA